MTQYNKVAATPLAGGVTAIVVWALGLAGVQMPTEAAVGLAGMLDMLFTYLIPNSPSQ